MNNYKKLGIKNFKRSKFKEAMVYFSLAYENDKDQSLLFLISLCSFALNSPEEAKVLFEYFLGKNKNKDEIKSFDEILEALESKEVDLSEVDEQNEQDAISYEDFMKLVKEKGNFREIFENIMFSTKVVISNKDDFLEFLENLIENNFIEMGMNYLESAAAMFGGDERIEILSKQIQKRQNDENIY